MVRVEEEACNFRSTDRKTKSSARTVASSFLCPVSVINIFWTGRLPLPLRPPNTVFPLHRLPTIMRHSKSSISRRTFRGCLTFLNSYQDDHPVQRAPVVALLVVDPVHLFPPTVSSNLLVEAFLIPALLYETASDREKVVIHSRSKSPRPRINQQSSQRTNTGYSAQHEVYESDWQYDSAHGPYLAAGDGSVWWGGPNSKGDGSDC